MQEVDLIKICLDKYPKYPKDDNTTITDITDCMKLVKKDDVDFLLIDLSKRVGNNILTPTNNGLKKTQMDYFVDNYYMLNAVIPDSLEMLEYDFSKKLVALDFPEEVVQHYDKHSDKIPDKNFNTLWNIIVEKGRIKDGYVYLHKLVNYINKIQCIDKTAYPHISEREYGQIAIAEEMKIFIKKAVLRMNKNIISRKDIDRNIIDTMFEEIDKLSTELSFLPKAIIHRNLNSHNVICYDGEPFVVGFYDLCEGYFIYDLITIINDPYICINKKIKEELVNSFWKTNKLAQEYSFEEFRQMVYKYSPHQIVKSLHSKIVDYYNGNLVIYKSIEMNLKSLKEIDSPFLQCVESYLPSGIISVVLAAGEGKRMKGRVPKMLCPLKDKPMIDYVIDTVTNINSDHVYVVVGHQKEILIDHLESRDSRESRDVKFIEQKKRMGTGHALTRAKSVLAGFTGSILVLFGNNPLITSYAIQNFIKYHEDNDFDVTIMSKNTTKPFGCKKIVRDANGEFKFLKDEQQPDTEIEVSVGVFLFKATTFNRDIDKIKKWGWFTICDILVSYMNNNNKVGIYLSQDVPPIHSANTAWQLEQLNKLL